MLQVDLEKFRTIAMDFYKVTNIKVVLYDEEERHLYSYPQTMCPFCQAVRSNPDLARQCLSCDKKGFDLCRKNGDMVIYQCHMGLTEAISPIRESGIIIGYLMIGQVLEQGHLSQALRRLDQTASLDTATLEQQLCSMPQMDRATLTSAVRLLSMCACYLWVHQIIQVKTNVLGYQLKSYIDAHLAEDLSVDTLCQVFYLSRSTLYQLSKEVFGQGISDYIRHRRIQQAAQFLHSGKWRICEVARMVGIPDANYFSRLFRREMGVSPKKYL